MYYQNDARWLPAPQRREPKRKKHIRADYSHQLTLDVVQLQVELVLVIMTITYWF